jgi:hypothetical protein
MVFRPDRREFLSAATAAGIATLVGGELFVAGQQDGGPSIVQTPNPLIATTMFAWYRPSDFEGLLTQPFDNPFDSGKDPHYDAYLPALRKHGVDAIAQVVTGFWDEGLGTDWQADNDQRLIRQYLGHGLQWFVYFDSQIRTDWKLAKYNNQPTSFRFNMDACPDFKKMVLDDFVRFAEEFVKPNMGGYLFLQDDNGQLILDEKNGQPRPLIAIFGSHTWHDDGDYGTLQEVCDKEFAAIFRDRGLGQPALLLDDLMYSDVINDPRRVAAFGKNAVAITTLMPVDPQVAKLNNVQWFGDWAPLLANLFGSGAERLRSLIADGKVHPDLQLWPGVSLNRDSRRVEGYAQNPGAFGWPALGPEDGEKVFRAALEANVRIVPGYGLGGRRVPRGVVPIYAEEFAESTGLWVSLEENGRKTYPYHYGDDPLESIAKVLAERSNLRTGEEHRPRKRLKRR